MNLRRSMFAWWPPRPPAAQATAARGSRQARRAPGGRRAFTLVELLLVVAIIGSLVAVALPILRAMVRDVKMNNGIARLKVGMQQAQALLADYEMADRNDTVPRIPNASFAGSGLLVRWDDLRQEYELSYLICNQSATASTSPSDYLALQADPSYPSAWRVGYSRFAELETIGLGTGIRVAGLRRRSGTASGLELVGYGGGAPCSSFALCTDVTGVGIPPAQQIYVNLQDAPPSGGTGPWNVWDPTFYDAAGATTGSHAAQWVPPSSALASGVGECFLTAVPMVIVYHEDDLPLDGASPSGPAWRIADAAGAMRLNPAVDPNEFLFQTRGRLVLLAVQGGSPTDY